MFFVALLAHRSTQAAALTALRTVTLCSVAAHAGRCYSARVCLARLTPQQRPRGQQGSSMCGCMPSSLDSPLTHLAHHTNLLVTQVLLLSARNALLSRLVLAGRADAQNAARFSRIAFGSCGGRGGGGAGRSPEATKAAAAELLESSGLPELEQRVLGFLVEAAAGVKLMATLDDVGRLLTEVRRVLAVCCLLRRSGVVVSHVLRCGGLHAAQCWTALLCCDVCMWGVSARRPSASCREGGNAPNAAAGRIVGLTHMALVVRCGVRCCVRVATSRVLCCALHQCSAM